MHEGRSKQRLHISEELTMNSITPLDRVIFSYKTSFSCLVIPTDYIFLKHSSFSGETVVQSCLGCNLSQRSLSSLLKKYYTSACVHIHCLVSLNIQQQILSLHFQCQYMYIICLRQLSLAQSYRWKAPSEDQALSGYHAQLNIATHSA